MLLQTTYQEKGTQTDDRQETKDLFAILTTLSLHMDSMGKRLQQLQESKPSQQHDYKDAELSRSEDSKFSELEGDVGKLRKTHNNVSLHTAAAPAEILYDEIKPVIQVVKIGLTRDMLIPEEIEQQPEIPKIEIPSFYANKRIIGITTIIQELANNYLQENAIWSYYSRDQLMIYANSRELRQGDMDEVQKWILSLLKPEMQPTTRALKKGFISNELLNKILQISRPQVPRSYMFKVQWRR
ncbi:uncharacterized protein [Nicotiana sylvestris]|uniref:uncharacterized protein n=1 Tax=Nicotiana sylvestris TaxID=4096 RepID=UPI00388C34DB